MSTSQSYTGRTGTVWTSLRARLRTGSWGEHLLQRVQGRLQRVNHARMRHARQAAIEAATRAIALYNTHAYAQAEPHFRAAIQKDATYARAHYGLGNTLAKLGRRAEARLAWKKAAEVEPGSDCAAKAQEKLNRHT